MKLFATTLIAVFFIAPVYTHANEHLKTNLNLMMGVALDRSSSKQLSIICQCTNRENKIIKVSPFLVGNNTLLVTTPAMNRPISFSELQVYEPIAIKANTSQAWRYNDLPILFKKEGVYTIKWQVSPIGDSTDPVKSDQLSFLCAYPSSDLSSVVSNYVVAKQNNEVLMEIFPLVIMEKQTANQESISFFNGDIVFAFAESGHAGAIMSKFKFDVNDSSVAIESLEHQNIKYKIDIKKGDLKSKIISTGSIMTYKMNVKEQLEALSLETGFYKIRWSGAKKNECSIVIYWSAIPESPQHPRPRSSRT